MIPPFEVDIAHWMKPWTQEEIAQKSHKLFAIISVHNQPPI